MQRRINMAIALMHQPAFLMMDEPTVGVDPQSREHIFDTIEQLRDQGTTILYTTHYMEEAERLCNRIAIMDEGQIVAVGTLEQLLAMRDQNREVQRPHGLQELFIQLTGKTLRHELPEGTISLIGSKKENIHGIYITSWTSGPTQAYLGWTADSRFHTHRQSHTTSHRNLDLWSS